MQAWSCRKPKQIGRSVGSIIRAKVKIAATSRIKTLYFGLISIAGMAEKARVLSVGTERSDRAHPRDHCVHELHISIPSVLFYFLVFFP